MRASIDGVVLQQDRAAEIEAADEQRSSVADGIGGRDTEAACTHAEQALPTVRRRQRLLAQLIDGASIIAAG